MFRPLSTLSVLVSLVCVSCMTAYSASPATPTPKDKSQQEINWITNLDKGFEMANSKKMPVMVDFFATWCGPCKMLDRITFSDPAVVKASKQFVSVRIDVDKSMDLVTQYRVTGFPTVIFFDKSGTEKYRRSGVVPAEMFLPIMNDVRAGKDPDQAMADLISLPSGKLPDDAGSLWRLAQHSITIKAEKDAIPYVEKLWSLPRDEVPNRPGAARLLGLLYARQDMPDKFHKFVGSIENSPDPKIKNVALRLKIVWAYQIEHDTQKSVELVNKLIEQTDDPSELAGLNSFLKHITETDNKTPSAGAHSKSTN
ncbi:MAG: thioredoxin family protein [Candidatus Hydrogenedentes bacterium]|nr:thioredoxin family protein [Candidatus Hydrogenedentota bacterium]